MAVLYVAPQFSTVTAQRAYASLTGNSSSDTSGPVLAALDLSPDSFDVSSTDGLLTMTARITDAQSGFQSSSGDFFNGTQGGFSFRFDSIERVSGTAQDGVYVLTKTVPAGLATGTWTITRFSLGDVIGNGTTYSTADLAANGFPTGFEVT